MKIKSLEEAVTILNKYVPKVATYSGDGMTLDRMWPILKAVGNPHEKLKVVHLAGTSGKTSTAYYIAARLTQAGKNVGLTVSPHVDSITERVQINGVPISYELFCSELGQFLDLIAGIDLEPSYFELLIVFVFWFFERAGIDYAVVETGMGGLLDGTNVLQRQDKVCVITDIGYDHMHILGNTLEEIATQKAGIIQSENQAFTYKQSNEIMEQIQLRADEKTAILTVFDYDILSKNVPEISDLPEFQKRNWFLADQVCKSLSERDNFALIHSFSPDSVIVPGRMDTVALDDGTILVMDGAHNGQKMQTFVGSFIHTYPNQKATVMLALKEGKEYKAVIDALVPIASSFILTTFSTSQDLPAHSQDTSVIAAHCMSKGVQTSVIENHEEASDYLLAQNTHIKLITGSFYLLGQVRRWLRDKSVLL